MFGRIAAFCLLSGSVLGFATDHILGTVGLEATFLPELFKFKTLPASSLQKQGSGRETEATDIARLAVLKQPLSVEALEALARSSATSEPQMSTKSLVQAAALGWRNIAVQVTVIRSAASAKNWGVAAPRLLALTKLNSLEAIDHSVFSAADAREYVPDILPAFAYDGLAWFKFTNWLRDAVRESESRFVLAQTPSYFDEGSCNQLGLVASEFIRDGEIEFAAELIDSRCRNYLTPPSSGLSIDKHFGDQQRGPFEWLMLPQSGVSFRTGFANGKNFVEITNSDPLRRKIAVKFIHNNSRRKEKEILFQSLNAVQSKPENLYLKYECAELGVRHRNSPKNDTSSLKGDCLFFRVSFYLATGHFRVWSE